MVDNNTDIVIIGAGLTGLTLAYYLKKAGRKFILIEKNSRVGGVIQTHTENGFTYESGPTTGVVATEEIVSLFEDLQDDCSIEYPDPKAEERWILKDNQWHALPSGLKQAVNTSLFTVKDKFRILGEPFRKKGNNPEETLAEIVKRRLGKSFLEYAVDPFVSGIYAGDPEKLVTKYALPKLYKLEQQYGSFIKGAIQKKKEPKTALQKKVNRKVFSVKGGLEKLIKALEKNIGSESIICNCGNITVNTKESGFVTTLTQGDGSHLIIHSSKVVSTLGAYVIPELLPFVKKELILPLTKMPYAKVIQVALGYKEWKGKSLNAFGGLVPTKENKNFLGILFPGSLFKSRVPNGGALLSVFMGGIKKPFLSDKSDNELKEIVLCAVRETLGETNEPSLIKVFRYEHAIPQYDQSSAHKLYAIEEIEKNYPGLHLAGNIRDGIGMADRVKQAKKLSNIL
jgi:oxygen-dependent protoporphyrinogen oxidase